MQHEERRRLEAVAYGRGSSDSDRAAAMRELKAADVADALRVAPSADLQTELAAEVPRRAGRARRWLALQGPWVWVGGAAAVAALGLAAVLIFAPRVVVPVDPRAQGEGGQGTQLTELVPVGDDLLANPPSERVRSLIDSAGGPRSSAVAATDLGEHKSNAAIGVLTDTGDVCIALMLPGEQGGMSTCVTSDEFLRYGVALDRGFWEVHWFADGTVVWEGI